MQPTYLSPAMPVNPGIDLYGGVAQPFTPFVNGMPVQPPAPSTTLTVSNHPCQGKGGSGCGCGGGCTAQKESVAKKETSAISLKDIKVPQATIDAYMETASLLKAGNSSLMTCITTAGEYLSAVAKVGTDLTVNLSVTEIRSGEIWALLNFIPKSGVGWVASSNRGNVILPMKEGLSLDTLTFAGLASAIAGGLLKAKVEAENNGIGTNGQIIPTQPILSPNTGPISSPSTSEIQSTSTCPCINQDLVCSAASGKQSDKWPWTGDHKHLQWWAPCVGSFKTDISSCCFNHDVALWCSHSAWEWPGINTAVALCVMDKVNAQAYSNFSQELSQFPWYLAPFEAITAAICYPLLSAWQLSLDLALVIPIELLFFFGELGANHNLYNFDHSHDCSCLCGGNQPTTQCAGANTYSGYDPNCTDICKLAGTGASLNEQCYNCGFICKYDASGNPSKVFDDGSDLTKNPNAFPCCPGTTLSCNPPIGAPCQKCANCDWACFCEKKYGLNWWFPQYSVTFPGSHDDVSNTGVRCCNGDDPKNPPPAPKNLGCDALTEAQISCSNPVFANHP